ncbi:hypothetical protein OG909_28200 [Streptomyces sp. NBC_01754]|uniref:hypothetical protein n=1 Tax=Streptomyces sp. NBC_01754 TaxID=2975930 RepID=UPI002DD869CD|nr:hypothetical protein [Streptomyces sp. NBC_01754]WSC95855.1 hypothetical protein OG909_28200 [Streptomyces sp. NBC_01754]
MTDDVRNIVLGVIAAGISATLGWFTRSYLWRRRLRRKQAFFGLPENSECLLVVNRDPGTDGAVHRHDVFALLELSAIVKDCSAHVQILPHDVGRQGYGEHAEFCVGGPGSNRRMAAHLATLLPGVRINTDPEPGEDRAAFHLGSERYRLEAGVAEHVLLARLTGSQDSRPVFLFCGQRAITNQAATRYLARNYEKLARKHRDNSFVLLLKVVNSRAYGPDVVEVIGDVSRIAQTPPPPAAHPAAG